MDDGRGDAIVDIHCSSAFRDAVMALARRRRVDPVELARSALAILPDATVKDFPDPGGPTDMDRDTVLVKSGPDRGKVSYRKPRLKMRLPVGIGEAVVRRALNLALALERGAVSVSAPTPEPAPVPPQSGLGDEITRLESLLAAISFEPAGEAVRSREEALHVLGYSPFSHPDAAALRARFRMLATVHHPDGALGSTKRMAQLNAAMAMLTGKAGPNGGFPGRATA
jgi:hypothetical protein